MRPKARYRFQSAGCVRSVTVKNHSVPFGGYSKPFVGLNDFDQGWHNFFSFLAQSAGSSQCANKNQAAETLVARAGLQQREYSRSDGTAFGNFYLLAGLTENISEGNP